MSDTERVRAWRQRLKEDGLVPMTIWVKAATKARYEDLAVQSHRSGSELAQLALEAYRLDPATVAGSVPDTARLRALIREELDQAIAIMTVTVTATVTETVKAVLPDLVQAAMHSFVSDTGTDKKPRAPTVATPEASVPDTDTATDTDTVGSGLPQGAPYPLVAATDTATVAETSTARSPATTPEYTGQRKLTVSQATALRAKRQRGIPIKALMEEYGLSRATVHRYLKPPTT